MQRSFIVDIIKINIIDLLASGFPIDFCFVRLEVMIPSTILEQISSAVSSL